MSYSLRNVFLNERSPAVESKTEMIVAYRLQQDNDAKQTS